MVRAASRPSLHPLERAVLHACRSGRLLAPASRALVALSGGADSTALLAILMRLRDLGELAMVSACHVDHGLRPDSAADAEACAKLCEGLGTPLDVARVEVERAGNLQAAARKARYAALRGAAARAGADRLATGHTRGDQAETVLSRLLRGAGARGLSGIPARRGWVVRPLLSVTRSEIVAYLGERGLSWREDPSNGSLRFLRNRLRAEVLPALEALAPGLEARLAAMARLLFEDDRALDRGAAALLSRSPAPSAGELLRAPLAIQRRVVRRLWRRAAGPERDLGAEHVEAVLRLAARGRPGRVDLPGGFAARVVGREEGGRLAIAAEAGDRVPGGRRARNGGGALPRPREPCGNAGEVL